MSGEEAGGGLAWLIPDAFGAGDVLSMPSFVEGLCYVFFAGLGERVELVFSGNLPILFFFFRGGGGVISWVFLLLPPPSMDISGYGATAAKRDTPNKRYDVQWRYHRYFGASVGGLVERARRGAGRASRLGCWRELAPGISWGAS